MAAVSNTSVNQDGQAPDTYDEIRDDLDSLMGDVQSASLLMTFITMREQESCEDTPAQLSPDFVGALFSVQNLLDGFKRQGDALVHRMMDLERAAEGKAVRS